MPTPAPCHACSTVPLAALVAEELAANVTAVANLARDRGHEVAPDDIGRMSVTRAAAAALIADKYDREAAAVAHQAAWRAHLDDAAAWTNDRDAKVTAAFNEVYQPAGPAGGPGLREKASAAAHAAGADYERAHARPTFNGHPTNTAHLVYVPEAEEGSLAARVKAGVKALVGA